VNANFPKYKLLITIVNYGMARKAVKASKEAGAGGGTTIIGKGTASRELTHFLGIPLEPEKEIILILVSEEKVDSILQAVISTAKLDKPGHGIVFIVGINKVAGIRHLSVSAETSGRSSGGNTMANSSGVLYDLVVTIVNKGEAETVVDASKKAGAEGGTILFGRGTGIHEHAKLFGITIEPEKEIILTLIDRQKSGDVLDAIVNETGLNKPGKGIAFIIGVEKVVGINHPLNRMVSEKLSKIKPQR
jgi:nitrogen regulatory protein PII